MMDCLRHHLVKLKMILLGKEMKIINEMCFMNCMNLEFIKISENITSIKSKSFSGCRKIKNISLPNKLKYIGYSLGVGGILGSGIFMVPATVALYTLSSSLFFLVWILGGIVSLFGALSVAELGAAMPKAGGQYVFLNKAYGPLWGFLYGWTAVAVINTASIAAVAMAFSEYLSFFFAINSFGVKSIAIISIFILTIINIVDVRFGAKFQNHITYTKIAAIVIIIIISILLEGRSSEN